MPMISITDALHQRLTARAAVKNVSIESLVIQLLEKALTNNIVMGDKLLPTVYPDDEFTSEPILSFRAERR